MNTHLFPLRASVLPSGCVVVCVLSFSLLHAQPFAPAPAPGSAPLVSKEERDRDDDDDDDDEEEDNDDDGEGLFDRLFRKKSRKVPPAPPVEAVVLPDGSLQVRVPQGDGGNPPPAPMPASAPPRAVLVLPPTVTGVEVPRMTKRQVETVTTQRAVPSSTSPPSRMSEKPQPVPAPTQAVVVRVPGAGAPKVVESRRPLDTPTSSELSSADQEQRREIERLQREVAALRKNASETPPHPAPPTANPNPGPVSGPSMTSPTPTVHTLAEDLALRAPAATQVPPPSPPASRPEKSEIIIDTPASAMEKAASASVPVGTRTTVNAKQEAAREGNAPARQVDSQTKTKSLANAGMVDAALDESVNPMAERIGDTQFVRNPFLTGKVIDVEGLPSGSLAKDPATGRVFRVP